MVHALVDLDTSANIKGTMIKNANCIKNNTKPAYENQ